jgi:hypothetical protein
LVAVATTHAWAGPLKVLVRDSWGGGYRTLNNFGFRSPPNFC